MIPRDENPMPRGGGHRHLPDPLIDEVREIRRRISEQFHNDPRRLGEHLRELDRQAGADVKFVEKPPRERGRKAS